MDIVLACDNNFAPYCATTIASVADHNIGTCFYLLTDNLSNENAVKLKSMTENMGSSLQIIYVDSGLFGDFPMPSSPGLSHISLATYFRLFIPLLLPLSVEKLIYLDCDIIVRHSIAKLYDIDIEDYLLGAVYHNDKLSVNNGAFKRLHIPVEQGYFNAGVLLINLKKWREEHIYEKSIEFLRNNSESIVNHDQDVLNVVCGKQTKMLSYTWNTMNYFFMENFRLSQDRVLKIYQKEEHTNVTDPVIIHFASRPKPWERLCIHPFVSEFDQYLRLTPYKRIKKKKNSVGEFWNLVIKPMILGYHRYTYIRVCGCRIYIGWLPILKRYRD